MQIKEWIAQHKLNAVVDKRIVTVVDFGTLYILIPQRDDVLFDNDMQLIVSSHDKVYAEKFQAEYYLFYFGERWYYSPIGKSELNTFNYIGTCSLRIKNTYPYLGVRGKYELMNGSRDYKDWCKKAAFLRIDTLGLCERNTLAGVPAFQQACLKHQIKPVIGLSFDLMFDEVKHVLKLFAINDNGWSNLLYVNKLINVDNKECLSFNDLLNLPYQGGCNILIIPTTLPLNVNTTKCQSYFWKVYYQLDLVEYTDNETDANHLKNIQQYIDKQQNKLEPILICDAFYLEQKDYHIKSKLNSVSKLSFQRHSSKQHFKTIDEIYLDWISLFTVKDKQYGKHIIQRALSNAKYVGKLCNFTVNTNVLHLPKYEMNDLESQYFDTNHDLFVHYIKRGLHSFKFNKNKAYKTRLKEEMRVIIDGGFIDYFLILADIVKWASSEDILTGIGRGSAGGSLVAYIMGITKLDPMKYGLIFERFLNESRLPKKIQVDIVKVSTDEGEFEFELNQRLLVNRNNKKQYILASQLQQHDNIINY